jgi:3-oxoacyl-[acyl-carrier-protein] synthase II
VSPQPVICGVGLVTPLGSSLPQTWDALLAGRYIEDHARVPLEFSSGLPRVSSLAIRAAREAAGTTDLPNAALVIGTSKGPVESWLAPPSRLSDVGDVAGWGLAAVASDVASELGIRGPRLTVSAACASGLHALIRGSMLVQSGQFNRVLVVACEASLNAMFLASFARLGVLPPAGIGCRPFSRSRAGFLMSEAAAAVLLGRDEPGLDVVVERFAIGADATHLTSMDSEGRTLRRVLGATLNGSPVDLVHAHGTGTAVNDEIELAALDDLLESGRRPALYSHKGALGHSLGAAGLVSVVLNVAMHRTGVVPPNVQTDDPMDSRKLTIAPKPMHRQIRRSIAIAAGFGGAVAAVALQNNGHGAGCDG